MGLADAEEGAVTIVLPVIVFVVVLVFTAEGHTDIAFLSLANEVDVGFLACRKLAQDETQGLAFTDAVFVHPVDVVKCL